MARAGRQAARKQLPTRMILAMVSVTTCSSPFALTIESRDMGYVPGNTYRYTAGSYSLAGIDLSAGAGKQWDFSAFSGNDHYNVTRTYAVSNDSRFPAATLAFDYEGKSITTYSGTTYLRDVGGDWQTLGTVSGGTTTTYSPYTSSGLPHTLGKTFTYTYTIGRYTQTATVTVIAEGTIRTRLGSHQALLVRTQTEGAATYSFETKEYGRIALLSSTPYLQVMISGTQNVGIRFHPGIRASGRDIFSGAGYPGSLSIAAEASGQARAYTLSGRLFGSANLKAGESFRMPAPSGCYIGVFAASNRDINQRVAIRK